MANWWDSLFGGNKTSSGADPYSFEYAEYQDYLNSSGNNNAGLSNLGLAGSEVGGSKTTGSSLGALGTSLDLGMKGLNAWTGYKELGLKEDAFNFNKQMQEKQYGLAKEAYDRSVARADSIGKQMQEGKVV